MIAPIATSYKCIKWFVHCSEFLRKSMLCLINRKFPGASKLKLTRERGSITALQAITSTNLHGWPGFWTESYPIGCLGIYLTTSSISMSIESWSPLRERANECPLLWSHVVVAKNGHMSSPFHPAVVNSTGSDKSLALWRKCSGAFSHLDARRSYSSPQQSRNQ